MATPNTIKRALIACAAILSSASLALSAPDRTTGETALTATEVPSAQTRAGGAYDRAPLAPKNQIIFADLSLNFNDFIFEIPKITFENPSFSRQELSDLFKINDAVTFIDLIETLSADSIEIERLYYAMDAYAYNYGNIIFQNVINGISSDVSVNNYRLNCSLFQMDFNSKVITSLNVPLYIKFITAIIDPSIVGMQLIHGEYYYEDIVAKSVNGFEMTIERISGAEFRSTLADQQIFTMTTELEKIMDEDKEPTLEDVQLSSKLTVAYIDWIRANPLVFDNIAIKMPEQSSSFSLASLTLDANGEGRPVGFSLTGLAGKTSDYDFSLGELSAESLSVEPFIEALRISAVDPTALFQPYALQSSVPEFGKWSASDFRASFPGAGGEERELTLASLLIDTQGRIHGIPTSIHVAMDSLAFGLAQDALPPGFDFLAPLRGIGYDKADLSAGFSLKWDGETQGVSIENAYVKGEGMGSISAHMGLGGAGETLFGILARQSLPTLMASNIDFIQIRLKDEGTTAKLLELQAGLTGSSAEDVSLQYEASAAMILGASPTAQKLAQAVGSFLSDPGEVKISLFPHAAQQLPVSELVSGASPASLLERVDILVTAQ